MSRLVSIVVRAFNEDRHIGRLMDGIIGQRLPDGVEVEVILVDSGSTDATVTIAERMGARIIHIQKELFSFGRALNLGCAAARGDILLFASAHVYPVYNDWIERMISHFERPRVALVYGRQIGNELSRFSEHALFAQWFPSTSNFNQSTPFCNNANCAIRRSLWLDQNFDESLTGLEDLEWADRIMRKGYQLVYDAEAPIVHVHEETSKKIMNRYRREAIALKRIMPHVSFTRWDFMRLLAGSLLTDFFKAIRTGVFLREARSISVFRLMQYYGTYLGHRQSGEVSKELKTRFYYPATSGGNAVSQRAGNDSRIIEYKDSYQGTREQ